MCLEFNAYPVSRIKIGTMGICPCGNRKVRLFSCETWHVQIALTVRVWLAENRDELTDCKTDGFVCRTGSPCCSVTDCYVGARRLTVGMQSRWPTMTPSPSPVYVDIPFGEWSPPPVSWKAVHHKCAWGYFRKNWCVYQSVTWCMVVWCT